MLQSCDLKALDFDFKPNLFRPFNQGLPNLLV